MTPELESHAEIHKTGHKWIDISVALCALVVSITSLVIGIMHGHTMERMAEENARLVSANSWPLLQKYYSDVGRNGERVTALLVANAGVGPAKVETLELWWKGRPLRSARELLEACCREGAQESWKVADQALEMSTVQGWIARPGATIDIYSLPQSAATEPVVKQLRATIGQVKARACYCSVFDECWISDLRSLHPQPVAQCPAVAVPFENQ